MAPLVTGILTTYQRPVSVVQAAFDSMVAQTYPNLELIVINDAPEDQALSDALARMIGARAKHRLVNYVVPEHNGGAPKARNLGIAQARGEYIGFLDDDDTWQADKVASLVAAMQAQPEAALVYCNAALETDGVLSGYKFDETPPVGQIFPELLAENLIGSCSFPLFNTAILRAVGGFDEAMPALQDWELYLRLLKNHTAIYSPQVLVTYAFYQGKRISTDPKRRIKAYQRLLHKIEAALSQYPKAAADFYLVGAYLYSLDHQLFLALAYFMKAFWRQPMALGKNSNALARIFARQVITPKRV